MHDLRRRIGTGIAAVGLLTIGLGFTAGPSYADENLNECPAAFNGDGDQPGHLTLETNLAGTTVEANTTITVTVRWVTTDWTSIDKVLNCVKVAGVDRDDLGTEIKEPDNTGSYVFSVPVAANTVASTRICIAARLSGNGKTQKTGKDGQCFTVVPASTVVPGGTTGGGTTGGGTTTQVEGTSGTQNGGDSSTGVSSNNATQTNGTGGGTTEVSGINFDAGNTTGSETLAANNSQNQSGTQGGAGAAATNQSGSALPATAGAIEPKSLASTGSATQALLLVAGLALLLGGLAFSFSSPRPVIA